MHKAAHRHTHRTTETFSTQTHTDALYYITTSHEGKTAAHKPNGQWFGPRAGQHVGAGQPTPSCLLCV